MKALNLYSGLGGNRKEWQDVDVTAVEINKEIADVYAEAYPEDELIIGDAHEYLLEHHQEYDFIWSSPPCQTHSRMNKATRHDLKRYPDMKLYQEIVFLDNFFDGKWVVENVMPYYEPLIPGKKIGRHIFWSNFKLGAPTFKNKTGFIDYASKEELMDFLGIKLDKNIYLNGNHDPNAVLRNCVHPEIGNYIFNRAKEITIKTREEKQIPMFT